jgi:ABC-type transport system substrate-binding protein
MLPSPQRTEVYRQMVEILNEDCPVLLLTEPVSFILVQPWVHNIKPHPIGYGMFKYRRIDMAQRAAAGGR